MKLSQIIKNCGVLQTRGDLDIDITGLANDSRKAGPGCLFAARAVSSRPYAAAAMTDTPTSGTPSPGVHPPFSAKRAPKCPKA